MTLLQISYESNDERILKIGQYFVKLWARDCFLTHSVDLPYRIEDKNTILVTANCRHHHCLAQGPLLASRAFINQSINHLIRARPTKHTHTHTHTRTLKKRHKNRQSAKDSIHLVKHFGRPYLSCSILRLRRLYTPVRGGSVAECLACWTQAQ